MNIKAMTSHHDVTSTAMAYVCGLCWRFNLYTCAQWTHGYLTYFLTFFLLH